MHAAWLAHLCGLCLTLRDEHGQLARLVTNYDGLLASVLVEAQAPRRSPRRHAGPCVLRGMRRAEVLRGEGARLAAAASLILAAARTRDHLADGDGAYRRAPVAALARRTAARWTAAGRRTARGIGFDPAALTAVTERQARAEASGGDLGTVTAPTEAAVAAVFAHTAVLAGRPGNGPALDTIGRHFGRVAHLLDAVEDHAADAATGAYNPLPATGTDLAAARRHCDDAVTGIAAAFDGLDLAEPALARTLLVREVRAAVRRTFDAVAAQPGQHPPDVEEGRRPAEPTVRPERPAWPLWCLAGSAVGCTCGLWRPSWDPRRGESCGDRCLCDCDPCSGCDCSDCCDCDCCDCGC